MSTWMDLAFSPAVKTEAKGSTATAIDANLAAFIVERRSFYLATASRDGQPYIQHRGGPPGFLNVLDEQTLAFADFSGNRQYITTGNLAENPRAMIFLMDYRNRRRLKIWGTARVVEDDPEMIARLFPDGYRARAEAAILFTVEAWDVNCPQHIPQMFLADDVAEAIAQLKERITALEMDNVRLRATIADAAHATGDAP
jgi:predicted pyridoxine 5'-phosphate oxidase superfamily flavin-nucleotide-binding protein